MDGSALSSSLEPMALDPGFVRGLIALVRRFHARHVSDPDDPVARDLHTTLAALNGDQLAEILALIGLGRGDFPVSRWDERRHESPWRDPRWSLGELFETPRAVEHLEDGLATLIRWA
jgi:hypothetical protein